MNELLEKYKKLTIDSHIIWMCESIQDKLKYKLYAIDLFKINRWLGYVQGYLVSQKMRTIEELREETRGLDEQLESMLNKE